MALSETSKFPPAKSIIFDIETDGLLDQLTKLHCLCLRDADTGAIIGSYTAETAREGLYLLLGAQQIIGHNILNFDVPALQKLFPWWKPDMTRCVDTLILARVLWPEIKTGDLKRWAKKTMPGNLIGRQGLEAWGHRLGENKGDYKDWCRDNGISDPWAQWTPEMQEYCDQDTLVNWKLWERIRAKDLSPQCIRLEHEVALLCEDITRHGFPFNVGAATDLYVQLQQRRDEALVRLQVAFPPRADRTVFIPKVNNKARGYVKGVPIERIEMVAFNPSAAADVAARLTEKYGWKPVQFTLLTREPQITEAILEGLPFAEIPDLLSHMLHAKIASMLASAKGDKGWLKLERDGRIHTRYETAGAVTGRATHSKPNIAQVPKVQGGPDGPLLGATGGYGWECRSLFTVPPGWFLVGSDMSGLELRCFAHYLATLDGGRYVELVTTGDVHTANKEAAGLPTRDNAKTFIYGFLYGAGAWKIGHIVAPAASDADKETTGRALITSFLSRTPGLKKFRDAVKDAAKTRGFLVGLDKRPLTIRKVHAAVNTLLQSAGAILCKQWIVNIRKALEDRGLIHSWNGDFVIVAWVHDEIQIACKSMETAETVAQVCKDEAVEVGEQFNFRCPLAGDAGIGKTWAETH